ncbi:hypothetical protein MJD09_26675 [bacterium]|nr:hypothetical protein [bacterium]
MDTGPKTKLLIHLLSLCLFLTITQATAQVSIAPQDSSASALKTKIRTIILDGNEKTREEIIFREMTLKVGSQFDEIEAEKDRLRILNLGIFNRVEIDAVPTSTGVILLVSVTEMWYIFPYPIIFRNERDWGRISVGAGLLHNNFRGRRELIDFSFWLGFNPSVRLKYTNPWIFGKLKFYTSISVFARKVRNLSFTAIDSSVNENQIGFDSRIGKRFGHFTWLDLTFGYRRLTLSPDLLGQTLSASGTDKLPQIGFSFTYDRRDLWEYPHRGHYLNVWARKIGFSGAVDYLRYGTDLRKYFAVGASTLAFRGSLNLSEGTIPIYDQVHFGFSTRIRGYFSDRFAGENRALGSAAFRFPIRKISYHNWGPFQGMGQYGNNFRFGVSGAFFVDTGALWQQNKKLTKSDFLSGWGAGLHFFLPYQNILRLEYAFNEDWDGQLIIDLFVAF